MKAAWLIISDTTNFVESVCNNLENSVECYNKAVPNKYICNQVCRPVTYLQ